MTSTLYAKGERLHSRNGSKLDSINRACINRPESAGRARGNYRHRRRRGKSAGRRRDRSLVSALPLCSLAPSIAQSLSSVELPAALLLLVRSFVRSFSGDNVSMTKEDNDGDGRQDGETGAPPATTTATTTVAGSRSPRRPPTVSQSSHW